MSHTSETPINDVIDGSEVLPTKVTVSHDIVSVKVCNNEELVSKKCEITSLGKIEMVDKQRRHCLADNCTFETKQSNNNGRIDQEPKVNKTTHAC